MSVVRTFHPVGQGGFYTETFDDSTNKSMVVFDCGGNSKKFMKEYMDSFLDFNPTVAVLLGAEMEHVDFFKDMEQIRTSFANFASLTGKDGVTVVTLK